MGEEFAHQFVVHGTPARSETGLDWTGLLAPLQLAEKPWHPHRPKGSSRPSILSMTGSKASPENRVRRILDMGVHTVAT